jgi:hypothetical protein
MLDGALVQKLCIHTCCLTVVYTVLCFFNQENNEFSMKLNYT